MLNVAYNNLLSKLQTLYDKTCPWKKVRLKKSQKKPWLTKGIIIACRKQKTLYKRYLKNRTNANEMKYKIYKNKLTNIKRISEKEYYAKLIENNKNNIKNMWRSLNEIIKKKPQKCDYPEQFKCEDGSVISNKNEISNKFNEYFVNVGPKLAEKIKVNENSNIYDYLDQPIQNSMYLLPVTEKELIDTVNQCKSKSSEDFNGLSMNVLKKIINPLIKPFLHICNLSFENGIVPDEMKIEKIIPLYKSGEKNVFNNYRPVALLPQLSKILEKLFCKRLNNFLEKNKVIANSQYGFRENRSTSTALLELLEEITAASDQNKYTVGVFIDLRKAFDTIDHNLLIKKLESYGLRGIVNTWLHSYLTNRKQYVELDKVSSSFLKVICGVPQGSVLGLYIIYSLYQ